VVAKELGCAECERCGESFRCEVFEVQGFAATGGTGDQRDVSAGNAEVVGEEGDECGVGAAVRWWGGEGDFERAIVDAGDGVAAGAGVNADGEGAAVGGGAELEAHA